MDLTVKCQHLPNAACKREFSTLVFISIIWLLIGASGFAWASDPRTATSSKGAVAADDGRCSSIGASVIRKGGHAVDAAVATTLCLGVVNPLASGIGGGGFMLVRSASTSQVHAYNMRETAPAAASQNMYDNDPGTKALGVLAMAVPGEIAGLHKAWLAHGRVPWKLLFKPAINLAKNGFIVSPYLAKNIETAKEKILADPGLQSVLAPNGRFLKSGDTCYNVKLGSSLEAIARDGPQAFYSGTIADNLVEEIRKAGGILTLEDLKGYQVDVTNPIKFNAFGYTIYGMSPPSIGTLGVSLVLNILEAYKTKDSLKGLIGVHRLIEALKHMFAIQMDLGDPEYEDISSTVSKMLSQNYAQKIHEKIHDQTTYPSDYYNAVYNQLHDHGTSHISVVDSQRNAVSMTTSVNWRFGAGILSPSTGIIMNNQMDDFSIPSEKSAYGLPPAPSNFIKPGKRPLSSMTPLIIMKDDELVGVLGGSGGIYIVPAVIQVFLNHFLLGMEPLQAVFSPRVHHQLVPNIVRFDDFTTISKHHIELKKETQDYLKSKGHILEKLPFPAVCQLIVQKRNKFERHGTLIAVSDPRKDGKPAAV